MLQTVARQGSFAAAARELGLVPSAVTYRVRQIEDALDALLFDRASRQAKLTAADHAIRHFHDPSPGIFHFTSDLDPALIARPNELHDNVIPASNSSMAKALFQLGHLFDDEGYLAISRQLMGMMAPRISTYPTGHSNWAQLLLASCSLATRLWTTGLRR